MSYSARRAAFNAIGETCPHVDEAFDDMYYDIMRMSLDELSGEALKELFSNTVERIKVQTTSLRDALILAYEEKEESEEELRDKITQLEDMIEELENQIE